MSAVDDYLKNNAQYALSYAGGISHKPSRQVAVIACMDCRLNVPALLGLADGEAHVLRNAGGSVTEDVIRSVTVSQRVLGTREIMLIHHTDCGMSKSTDDAFKAAVEADTGIRPPWAAEMFTDAAADVRQSVARLKASPFIPYKDAIRGFVFDVAAGKLNEVL